MVKKIGYLSIPDPEAAPAEDDAEPVETGSPITASPLAMTSDPKQYNATMQGLLGQLVDTPEQQEKNELLAWGGGLTDPAGTGNNFGALGAANAAQSKYRLEDKRLRAQYIPMIMQALSAGQAKAGGVDLSNINFRGMPEEEVARLSVAAKRDLLPYWKQANIGEKVEGGTYTMQMNPQTRKMEKVWNLKVGEGQVVNPDNTVSAAQGAPEAQAEIAGTVTGATEKAKAGWTQVKVVGPDNTEYTMFQNQANPGMFSKDSKGTGAAQLPPGMKITPMQATAGPQGAAPGGGGTGTTAQGGGGPRSWDDAVALVESNGNPNATSPKGATGPMQTMPATLKDPGYGIKPAQNDSIEEKTRVGREYRAKMQSLYGEQGGLAAYNMGPDAFDKWQKAGGQWSKLPAETRDYIGKVNLAREGHGIYGGNAGRSPPVQAPPSPQVAQPVAAPAAPDRPGVPAGAIQTGSNPVVAQRQQETGAANKVFIEKDIPAAQKAADQANVMRDQIKQQRDAIANGAATGRWADVITKASEFGAAFGWEGAEKIATSSGEFNNAVRKQVFSNLALQNGVQTEGDASRMREALVNLKDTPKLTGFLLAAADATAKREQDKAAFYNKAAQQIRDGKLNANYADIDQAWRERMPPLHKMDEMKEYAEYLTPKKEKK
jgi:soluble lytic murein transglycosylase-like protein